MSSAARVWGRDWRRGIWIGAAVLAAAALGVAYALLGKEDPKRLTAVANVSHIEDTVLASGTIEPFKLVNVGAQASGRILALHVSLGDSVVKGLLIGEIDPSTQRNALEIAEATLDQERAQRDSRRVALRQAALAFKRAQTTYAEDATSQADYETAEAAYNGTKADVAALDAQIRQAVIAVDTAHVNLGYTKVTAPIDGTVVAVVTPEGATVNAVQTAPTIVKLADLSRMTVKAQISEADVTRVRPGQKVYFTILGRPDHPYQSTLRALEPAPESIAAETATAGEAASASSTASSAVYYNGLFEIDNRDGQLRPAMTAEVHIVLEEARNALVVPSAALRDVLPDGRRMVLVLNPKGRVESRLIRVGLDNHVEAQVLRGLAVGERVVIGESTSSHAK